MKIVLATHNSRKRDEIQSILASENLGIELLTLDDQPVPIGEIEESGSTLEANARIKARVVAEATGLSALADDTGLEVDALGGAPGVYSARYAGPHASYGDNVEKLLDQMRQTADRDARFRTVLCFVDEFGNEHFFEGAVDGVIVAEPRGEGGFGYDPVFQPLEADGRTFAELTPQAKNEISHRGRAIRAFAQWMSQNRSAAETGS